MNIVIQQDGRALLAEHDVQVHRLEDLLERVECQARQLALDQIWPVLHNCLELHVPVRALPPGAISGGFRGLSHINHKIIKNTPGHQMEHVHTLGRLPIRLARRTRQLDTQKGKHRLIRDLVLHLHQPRVEVDLARQRADGQKRGVTHDQQRRHGLVEEPGVDVGGLLEYDDVASGTLRCGDLRVLGQILVMRGRIKMGVYNMNTVMHSTVVDTLNTTDRGRGKEQKLLFKLNLFYISSTHYVQITGTDTQKCIKKAFTSRGSSSPRVLHSHHAAAPAPVFCILEDLLLDGFHAIICLLVYCILNVQRLKTQQILNCGVSPLDNIKVCCNPGCQRRYTKVLSIVRLKHLPSVFTQCFHVCLNGV